MKTNFKVQVKAKIFTIILKAAFTGRFWMRTVCDLAAVLFLWSTVGSLRMSVVTTTCDPVETF